jgi:hypothetical protein
MRLLRGVSGKGAWKMSFKARLERKIRKRKKKWQYHILPAVSLSISSCSVFNRKELPPASRLLSYKLARTIIWKVWQARMAETAALPNIITRDLELGDFHKGEGELNDKIAL